MEEQNGLYFTMAYGILDLSTFEFRFVSAGHDPIVHVTKSGVPQMVEGNGTPIGWFEEAEYEDHLLKLQSGDRLYLYSDGVPEAMDAKLNQFTMNQCSRSWNLDKCKLWMIVYRCWRIRLNAGVARVDRRTM